MVILYSTFDLHFVLFRIFEDTFYFLLYIGESMYSHCTVTVLSALLQGFPRLYGAIYSVIQAYIHLQNLLVITCAID